MFSFKRHRLEFLFVILAVLAFSAAAFAQSITGSISGTVTDSTGGVIPGATVTLTGDLTGGTRTATTNREGRFNFARLQPGNFSIKGEHQGFQLLGQKRSALRTNESLRARDLQLQPGPGSATVTLA